MSNPAETSDAVSLPAARWPALFITISNNAQLARQSLRFVNNPGWWCSVVWLCSCFVLVLLYCHIVHPALRFWNGIITHGDPKIPTVAFTFDDGPSPLWAPLLADTLERHGARGTFFLVGFQAEVYPEISKRLIRAGHEVENHSLTHPYPNLTALPETGIRQEIAISSKILRQLTGAPIRAFRPPGGGLNDTVLAEVKREGMHIGWWSANTADATSPSPEGIIALLHKSLRPGAVVLMHERANSVAALERFLDNDRGAYRYETFLNVVRP